MFDCLDIGLFTVEIGEYFEKLGNQVWVLKKLEISSSVCSYKFKLGTSGSLFMFV